jgi:hypothetical protein
MQCNFFAFGTDLLPVLEQVDRKHRFTYVASGLFTSPVSERVELGARLTCSSEGYNAGYLVTPDTTEILVRPVPQRKGGFLYAVDELANPSSITLHLGGMVCANVLLPGSVGTVSTHGSSVVLHRAFVCAIGKCFKRVKSYRVGPAALSLLAQGVRLTSSAKAPREYDLVLPEVRGV